MLMMGDKKKKLATMLVGKMSDEAGKEVDMNKPESDHEAGYHAAAGELISAIHSKDEKRAHQALLNHYKMCSMADEHQAQDTAGMEANQQNFND